MRLVSVLMLPLQKKNSCTTSMIPTPIEFLHPKQRKKLQENCGKSGRDIQIIVLEEEVWEEKEYSEEELVLMAPEKKLSL